MSNIISETISFHSWVIGIWFYPKAFNKRRKDMHQKPVTVFLLSNFFYMHGWDVVVNLVKDDIHVVLNQLPVGKEAATQQVVRWNVEIVSEDNNNIISRFSLFKFIVLDASCAQISCFS